MPAVTASDMLDALASWPADRPVIGLFSAGVGPWSTRSLLAEPRERIVVRSAADLPAFWDALGPRPAAAHSYGGWVGWFSYELGAVLEPAAGPGPAPAGPLAELWRVDEPWQAASPPAVRPSRADPGYHAGALHSSVGRERYTRGVRRALDDIAAGDIYQVNLTHTLEASFEGSTRALAADVISRTSAWYGGYIETPGRTIVSTSPELLVSLGAQGRIVTRPIKGTSPSGRDAELAESAKDAAELAMIVDLMRHDIGRICTLGSVRVERAREIESHAGVTHTVGTITGQVRPDAAWEEIIRAVFPAGSISGAPKIRAMQIIAELEGTPRGPYCGSLVWIGDDGSLDMNVGIRSAEIAGGRLRLGVGAGIVADSDPEFEWTETLLKADGFRRAIEGA